MNIVLKVSKRIIWGLMGLALLLPAAVAADKKAGKNKNKISGMEVEDYSKIPPQAEAYYHFSMGRLLEEGGDSLKAQDEYKKAIELDPQSSSLRLEMANVQLRRRNLRMALQETEAAIRLNPDNVEAHKLLATIYLGVVGNEDPNASSASAEYLKKALQEYETIVKLSPEDSSSLLSLGDLYRRDGQTDKAIASLKKYLEAVPASDMALSLLSEIYVNQGNFNEAIGLLKKALEASPGLPTLLAQLAFTYEQAKDYKNAIETYKLAVAADDESLNLRKGLAQALWEDSQDEPAEKEYLRILESDPEEGVAYLRLGQIYRRRGDSDKALENFQKADGLLVGSVEVKFNIAVLYEEVGKYEKGEEAFKQLLKLTEKNSDSYSEQEIQNRTIFLYHAGAIAQQLEKYPQAIEYFSQMKALNPHGEIRAEGLIIETQRMAKHLDKALQLCDEAIKTNPDDLDYKLQRAELLGESGKVDPAIEELRSMLTGKDQDVRMYNSMVQVYEKARNFKEAEKTLLAGEKLYQNKEQFYFMLGAVCERQKEYEQAEANFRKVLALNPKHGPTLNYLGYMLADQNVRLPEALEMLKLAVSLEPNNGAFLDSLGWIYFRMNQMDKAETYLEKAKERVRKDATIQEHLGDLYNYKGELKEARAAYELSVANNEDEEEGRKVQKKLEDLKIKMVLLEKSKVGQK